MPIISIGAQEKLCCNCASFKFCIRERPRDALFSAPPNVGYCSARKDLTRAIKRSCPEFERQVSRNQYIE